MCHCFEDVTELSADEREEIVESHTRAELEAELDDDELSTLGLAA
ncbi:hypothetical protein OB955_12735 [Halobacteria archaeon AArc-m2/3/4]|uniref:Uncharacterized protein n=1 Tax=Natronoglomus mannanivorans TaxID=2979990 RepID=A0AAP2YXD2_9EURY|nr:hypothetical protein [Halobacteria archaeon AArc-xg1-1]MCU4973602.1 hypothetical protein [Halobacteria archaeon AArc-m2/3/4]